MADDDAVDWSTRPKAGWPEFCARRARFYERLMMQAEVRRLERAWWAPSREPADRRPAAPAP